MFWIKLRYLHGSVETKKNFRSQLNYKSISSLVTAEEKGLLEKVKEINCISYLSCTQKTLFDLTMNSGRARNPASRLRDERTTNHWFFKEKSKLKK